jgi:site-specific DNA recombinase
VRQDRANGGVLYGYVQANKLDDKGGVIRALRDIDPENADIVRRMIRSNRFVASCNGSSTPLVTDEICSIALVGGR